MPQTDPVRLADLTTMRVGGPAQRYLEASTTDELVDAVREVDDADEPLLIVAGGSNLVVADEGVAGTVVRVATRGITVESADHCGGAMVRVAAGESWDGLVERAVAEGWSGIEALSGIPGATGSTPIQNVGAYGQEVAQTITRVRTWDREAGAVRTFFAADCAFAYRDSIFKRTPYGGPVPSATGRYVVLSVTFQHRQGDLSAPIRYAELARQLGVEVGDRAPMTAVRETVLRIRASKGMVLDSRDHDTWSAGSFFTNPILTAEEAARLPEDAPRFSAGEGRVKTSAAWLISHAGFDKGFAVSERASLSTKHSLALTNRGGATSEDLRELATTVQAGVAERFGVRLEAEPVRLGVEI